MDNYYHGSSLNRGTYTFGSSFTVSLNFITIFFVWFSILGIGGFAVFMTPPKSERGGGRGGGGWGEEGMCSEVFYDPISQSV